MNHKYLLVPRILLGVIAGFPCLAGAWLPGTYPSASQRMHTHGFAVDNQNRNDVVAFWHAVYQASEGYESRIGWTGNYSGNSGNTSRAFVDDVERRLNYFRAMCGLPSDANVNSGATVAIEPLDPFKPSSNTEKAAAVQDAALMLIRNFDPATGRNPAISHDPAANLAGWTKETWNAAAKSNLAFGVFGPAAITEYMIEELTGNYTASTWNALVGHRRWNLYPAATDYATGDQPGISASRPPTNVFYVGQKPGELRPQPSVGFVPYPAAGFFPAPINSRYWSLSREGADFTAATVRMTDSTGKTVPVSGIKRDGSYGDPSMIWEVGSSAATKSVLNDTTFDVFISGIAGPGIPTTYNYSVTLINPNSLTSNQKISGLSLVTAGKSGNYTFTPPTGAENVQVIAYQKNSGSWQEDAEIPAKARVIVQTTGTYSLFASAKLWAGFGSVAGDNSFRLTFPTSYDVVKRGVHDQCFEIDREIVPSSNAKLNFNYRRGFMTKSSSLAVEVSSDGGLSWKSLGSIRGVSDTAYDQSSSSASYSLPKSKSPVRVRFRYFYSTPGGAIYTHEAAPGSPTGILIDDITTKGCECYEPVKINRLPTSSRLLVFQEKTAGMPLKKNSKWQLRMQVKLGGKWFPPGPPKEITIKP